MTCKSMLRFMQARRRAGLSEESMLILLCVRWAGAASRLDLAAECAINPPNPWVPA